MLQDLDIIKNAFETKYAPFEWKKSHFGWSLEEQMRLAKIKILTFDSLTVKDYQRILHAFFISTCDYHVQEIYYSTELALLPFEIKKVNGKYFITEVQTEILRNMEEMGDYQGEEFPQIGNQLILFDSQPIEEIIEELKICEVGNPTSQTSQIMAEKVLTKRLGFLGHHVPSGPIKIRFKNAARKIINATITWSYNPEKIRNRTYRTLEALGIPDEEPQYPFRTSQPNTVMMINSLAKMLQKDYYHHFAHLVNNDKIEADLNTSVDEIYATKHSKPLSRESIVFGKKIWSESTKSDFNVYIYQLPHSDKRIGHIRIKTFYPPSNLSGINKIIARLAKAINHLEAASDALVIDQVNNPGGIGIYALAIASMLTTKPLILPQNHFTITQADVHNALEELDDIKSERMLKTDFSHSDSPSPSLNLYAGYPIDDHFINGQIKHLKFTINQWNKGNTLTDPAPLLGIKSLRSHPLASYSKPILVLVNGYDFSCGDFFPAILQDNNRAIIFGEKTAGAGGAVEEHSYPNSFGLASFTLTVSIAERLNGKTIENLGVTPDIEYEITEKDFLKGYEGYIKAVNETLRKML